VKATSNRSGAKLGWLDYLLTAIGSILAVYSAGMSIDTPSIGIYCGGFIVVGTLCSFTIKALAGSTKAVRADGVLYAIAAIGAIIFAPSLMALLPDGGFPIQMVAAGGLCWMLIFGSFLSWGDSTLLFQAVPGIALFGLVGCYDTYRNVVFAFFGFLICLCTGFARAHGREMLRRAAESGFFNRAGIQFDPNAPEQSAELYDNIRKGPWRWVAGPEWALASALAIVLISLLGAPVIQSSVQGVAGFASIKIPTNRRAAALSQSLGIDQAGTTNVGQGPVTGLTGQPIYDVKLDHARYLRTHAYVAYTGKGWNSRITQQLDSPQALTDFTLAEIKTPTEIEFKESPRVSTRRFALPGDFDVLEGTDIRLYPTPDGGYETTDPVDVGHFISGKSLEARDPESSLTAIHPTPPVLQPYDDVFGADPRVLQLARDATASCKNDREKANALMQAIADRAQYNANVAATPPGEDPVAYFLFSSHQGYCDVFASAMVLMARSVEIPARYVTGYLPDEQLSLEGLYVVRDKDYHAWAELFFKDVGWVVFDPTTLATMVQGGDVKVKGTQSFSGPALTWTLNTIIASLVGGAGWLLLRAKKQGAPTEKNRRSEVDQIYVTYARTIRSFTGRRRLLSETPSEYLAQTRTALNGAYVAAERLTRRFEALLYSPGETTPEIVADLRADLRELKKMLRLESKAKKPKLFSKEPPSSP
jgi:transglutaminase-like putative cysteine protease